MTRILLVDDEANVLNALVRAMVLGRGLSPADAAEQVLHLIGYAGDKDLPDSPYPAAGFRILMPEQFQDPLTV